MTEEALDSTPEPELSPHPGLAFLADLLLAPLGHWYVGSRRRGIVLWIVTNILIFVAIAFILVSPGFPSLVTMWSMIAMAWLILPLDALLLARRARSQMPPRERVRWYVYLAVGLLFAFLSLSLRAGAREALLQAFRMPAESMVPTLLVGDFLFVDKTSYDDREPSRGDIVVFLYPMNEANSYLKRVIALPGDVIEIHDKQVLVNGSPLREPYVVFSDSSFQPANIGPRDNFGPYRVPDGSYFVMGDNRDNSNDSRYWGPVPRRLIKGKATMIYWSWDPDKSAARWKRVGSVIR